MAEQKILVGRSGEAARLVSYPRVLLRDDFPIGIPLTASVRIATPSTPMPSTFSAASVDSTNTTVSSDAAEGADSLEVGASLVQIPGRRFVVAPTDGQRFEVELKPRLFAGTTVRLAEPLNRSVPATSVFAGYACIYNLLSAHTTLPGECLAEWKVTWRLEGAAETQEAQWAQAFRLVRRLPVSVLTPTRLTKAFPVMHTLRNRKDETFEELIETAWTHRVLPLLEMRGMLEENIVAVDALEPLHSIACVVHRMETNPKVSTEIFERTKRRFDELVEGTFARRTWYETEEQDETPQPRPEGGTPRPTDYRLRR